MKMIVRLLAFCVFTLALANQDDGPTQMEKYVDKIKAYQLDVPGKDPITIIENVDSKHTNKKWKDFAPQLDSDDIEMKNLMTHIVHDVNENNPRCYGPSCQDGFNVYDGPQKDVEEDILDIERFKDYRDYSKDRLEAINALAAKLKKDRNKVKGHYSSSSSSEQSIDDDDDNNGKVYTSWNRLKVKQHKHPFDDKDGWVSLEPVAWSTSKISKWKPNVKKQKPNHWNDDDDNRFHNSDQYPSYQGLGNSYSHKKPFITGRPGYINNKLHVPQDYDTEMPSKPSWANSQQASYPATWSPDEGRRPHKPHCNKDEAHDEEIPVYLGLSDSLVTDNRPFNYPYDYEALHQSSVQRPLRRPTQVVYAGTPDYDSDRASRPPYGDGQWVLLSTTKGYRNKKRHRSLSPPPEDHSEFSTMTSHQAVALTVLPVDNAHKNMTTSHGGLLEVEKSFKTVEESKRDMDKRHDLGVAASQSRPVVNRVVKRKVMSNMSPGPDSSTVLAAVGAGMVPATMAMVVPMMLGRRRRRDLSGQLGTKDVHLQNVLHRYE